MCLMLQMESCCASIPIEKMLISSKLVLKRQTNTQTVLYSFNADVVYTLMSAAFTFLLLTVPKVRAEKTLINSL